jgi:hypothetical protein
MALFFIAPTPELAVELGEVRADAAALAEVFSQLNAPLPKDFPKMRSWSWRPRSTNCRTAPLEGALDRSMKRNLNLRQFVANTFDTIILKKIGK